jgi:hypothetical protein
VFHAGIAIFGGRFMAFLQTAEHSQVFSPEELNQIEDMLEYMHLVLGADKFDDYDETKDKDKTTTED